MMVTQDNVIKRLDRINAIAPRYNQYGMTIITREAMDTIKETCGEAEILIHRLAFMCCDLCGVCPKSQQNPFDCEIIGTEGKT